MNMADEPAAEGSHLVRPRLGLSGKLLVLTLLFVMIAEVLIYVPSIANFRLNWLNDRLSAAYTAALVLETAPNGVSDTAKRQILDSIGAHAVAVKMGQQRQPLAVSDDMPPAIHHDIDTRDMPWHRAIIEAFETLLCADNDVMRVMGPAPMGGEFVEIVLNEQPLRQAMLGFSVRILILSLIISAITAALVYLALHFLLVRPMRRMTANMVAFRADPENPARIIAASDRNDEIGTAERELAAMQSDLAALLAQKNHLAALGLAVSKINHDLRNLLTSAQLFSERLAKVADPHVQRFAPQLMRVFTSDQRMIDIGADAIRVVALAQPLWAATFVYAGALRGTGNTRVPLLITGIALWSVVGLGYISLALVQRSLAAIWLTFLIVGPIETACFWWVWRRWRRPHTQ